MKKGRTDAAANKKEGKPEGHRAVKGENRTGGKKRIFFRSKMSSMAAANLGRDKNDVSSVVLSMALSLVLFNTIYTFSIGFDMDKYLSKFLESDFLVAHSAYFNYRYSGIEESIPESMIEDILKNPAVEENGRIYSNIRDTEFLRQSRERRRMCDIRGTGCRMERWAALSTVWKIFRLKIWK